MPSGREIAEAALEPALSEGGWNRRAAGWFTKELRPGVTGVLAVSAASRHHQPGSASVTIMVGLRDESIEKIVEQVCGSARPVYRQRTWVRPLGYLLPGRDFRDGERVFDSHNAEAQAEELAHLLTQQAEPRLRQLGGDPEGLREMVESSTTNMGPSGLCRVAVLAARTQGPQAASEYVAHRIASLGDRTDPAADRERDVAPRVVAALGSA